MRFQAIFYCNFWRALKCWQGLRHMRKAGSCFFMAEDKWTVDQRYQKCRHSWTQFLKHAWGSKIDEVRIFLNHSLYQMSAIDDKMLCWNQFTSELIPFNDSANSRT